MPPIVIPKSGGGSVPYTTGSAYNINDLVDFHGITYRVTGAIAAPAPAIPDYSKLKALGLGSGAASYKNIDTDLGADVWINIASFPSYFSGSYDIGGLYNGRQAALGGKITTQYNTSTIEGTWNVHAGGTLKEVRLFQPGVGQPWQLWLRMFNNSAGWQQEFVSTGAGQVQTTVPASAVSQTADPGRGRLDYSFLMDGTYGGSFSSIAPASSGAALASCVYRSDALFDVAANGLCYFYIPGWHNTTSDTSILTLGDDRITVNEPGTITMVFAGKSRNGRRMQMRHNGTNLTETNSTTIDTFATISETRAVTAGNYLQLRNPGTGGASWNRLSFTVHWVGVA